MGIVNEVRLEHLQNISLPMVVTESEILNLVRFSQFMNALSSIVITE